MRLYNISEEHVQAILIEELSIGKSSIIDHVEGIKYPLKIVFESRQDEIFIITAYPLKKSKP